MAYYPSYYPYYQQSYTNNPETMHWVEDEAGAKTFQQPSWLPANVPIALWDQTEKKIFLKSWNQMGMANPMQELDYEIKERTNPALLPQAISGDTQDMSRYATKDDIEELKKEIRNMNRNRNDNRGDNK